MADKTEETTETEETEEKETKEVEEETPDESKETESTEESEETEETSSEEEPFTKQFTQFKGEGDEYTRQLEEAYKNSTGEANKLLPELKKLRETADKFKSLIADNPELAEKVEEETGERISSETDILLNKVRSDMRRQNKKEYDEFKEKHPEIETDPALGTKLMEELAVFGAAERAKGQLLPMGEGLRKAWISLGLNDEEETLTSKVKDSASSNRASSGGKKTEGKTDYTDAQLAWAKKAGVKLD